MTTTVPSSQDLLYPLSLFRRRDHRPLPLSEVIDGAAMPEPYRSLLVHFGDMTSRLEEFHRSPMRLRVLHVENNADTYRREVLLCSAKDDLPAEYGAIEINLAAFPQEIREQILKGQKPLGGLLNEIGFKYRSEPRGFFRFLPDLTLCRLFGVEAASAFFGRSNFLLADEGAELARIVEVLRP
jgi:chorismate-pyruvate lyase